MQLSKIDRIKDPYNLWYEYLKRSKKYKKYCTAMRAGKTPKRTEENAKFLDVYHSWGDVFVNSFNESYKKFKSSRRPPNRQAVADYKPEIRKKAINIAKEHKYETGKKITLSKLINQLEREFERQTIVPKIDPTRGSDKEILTKVKDALKEKRRQPSTRALELIECVNTRLTTKSPRVEDLKRYLKVWDLRESGMKNRKVIQVFGYEKDEDTERKFKRYYATAEKIIENAEQGLFPGDYQPYPEEVFEYRVIV